MVPAMLPQASTTRSPIADLDKFEGFTHAERRADGHVVLEKTIDFSHPKAPPSFDVLTRQRYRGLGVQVFLVDDREAYILYRGA